MHERGGGTRLVRSSVTSSQGNISQRYQSQPYRADLSGRIYATDYAKSDIDGPPSNGVSSTLDCGDCCVWSSNVMEKEGHACMLTIIHACCMC